ncbi:MAG: helix-turn-helix transcriptional regulator [Flavobacteriaceae bacterium]
MVNNEAFIKRLEQILQYYGLSASAFADSIGVQRSSISHLLSGRNKPSLEFVLKVIRTYPDVNLYWLLNGKGSFPQKTASASTTVSRPPEDSRRPVDKKTIQKIVIFYDDGSFEAFEEPNGSSTSS